MPRLESRRRERAGRPADCESAIQQIINLRYLANLKTLIA